MKTKTLKIERLREKLVYDDEHWGFIKNNKTGKPSRAGTIDKHGKRIIMIDGVMHFEHRLVLFYHTGHMPKGKVFHLNKDKLDNRFQNLTTSKSECRKFQSRPKQISVVTSFARLVTERVSFHTWLLAP